MKTPIEAYKESKREEFKKALEKYNSRIYGYFLNMKDSESIVGYPVAWDEEMLAVQDSALDGLVSVIREEVEAKWPKKEIHDDNTPITAKLVMTKFNECLEDTKEVVLSVLGKK